MTKVLIHTASLYYWFPDYEKHLDDRIHAALDAGLDGVEISNGPSMINWKPALETVERLKNKTVCIHAEIGESFGVSLNELIESLNKLPFQVSNLVIHPDELTPAELANLHQITFPVSLENMDSHCDNWRLPSELSAVVNVDIGLTFDTAHAEENGLSFADFLSFSPVETHLSIANTEDFYRDWGYSTHHALTVFRPDNFPQVPRACPIITLEGLVPPDKDMLKYEIDFVKSKL